MCLCEYNGLKKGMLAKGTVVWNDYENNVVKIIKGLLIALSHQYALFYYC